jgi:hypothetical protein
MPRRAEQIRAVGRDGLIRAERGGRRTVLRFRPEVRARVEEIVAAESSCCAFLDFELVEDSGAIVLSIAAPDGGEPAAQLLADLFAADRPDALPASPAWSASQSPSS